MKSAKSFGLEGLATASLGGGHGTSRPPIRTMIFAALASLGAHYLYFASARRGDSSDL
jgi:hypothetical protein